MQNKAESNQPAFTVTITPQLAFDNARVQVSYHLPKPVSYKPQDYIFCVDISGSMKETTKNEEPQKGEKRKIDLVKEAILAYVKEHLQDEDTVSIVTFDTAGKQIINPIPKQQFLADRFQTFEKLDAGNNGTYMQGAFEGIDASTFADKNKPKVVILLTDGKDASCRKTTDIKQTNKIRQEKCGINSTLLIASIGEDPDLPKLTAMLKEAESPMQFTSHIAHSDQVIDRVGYLANFAQTERVASLSFSIKIGEHEENFKELNVNYGIQESLSFPVKLSELNAENGEKEADKAPEYVTTSHITYQYGTSNQPQDQEGEFAEQPITYKPASLKGLNKARDEALVVEINECILKIANDPIIKEICAAKHLLLHKTLAGTNKETVERSFNSLLEMEKIARETLTEPDADAFQAMNDLNSLLRTLASHLFHADVTCGNGPKKPANRDDLQITNAFTNRIDATLTAPTKGLLAAYQKGARTVNQDNVLVQGVAEENYSVDPHDNRSLLKLDDGDYKCIDSGFDFVDYCSNPHRKGLAYVDGNPTSREILLVDINSLDMVKKSSNFMVNTETFNSLLKKIKEVLQSPETPELQKNFNIAVFNRAELLKLKNGKEIPCAQLSNFIDMGVGRCTHQAMTLALHIAREINKKDLKDHQVNLVRATAFNQDAHAFVIVKTPESLFLVDPLLDKAYDLRNKNELEEAAFAHLEKGVPGILLNLIEREGLDMDETLRKGPAFDIPEIDAALIEANHLDENKDFDDWVDPITTLVPSRPVRPMLYNETTKEYEPSLKVYEQEALEEWAENHTTDPLTRKEMKFPLPAFDDESSKQCRRDLYRKISQLCVNAERSTEADISKPRIIKESDERKATRRLNSNKNTAKFEAALKEHQVNSLNKTASAAVSKPPVTERFFSLKKPPVLPDSPGTAIKKEEARKREMEEQKAREERAVERQKEAKLEQQEREKRAEERRKKEQAEQEERNKRAAEHRRKIIEEEKRKRPLKEEKALAASPVVKDKEKELAPSVHFSEASKLESKVGAPVAGEKQPLPDVNQSDEINTEKNLSQNSAKEKLQAHINKLKDEIEQMKSGSSCLPFFGTVTLKEEKLTELKRLKGIVDSSNWIETLKNERDTNVTIRKTTGWLPHFLHQSRSEKAVDEAIKLGEGLTG